MFMHLLRFELQYWLRQPIVYIFFLVNALLVFGATVTNDITIGGGTGNVLKNAPYVVQNYYALFSLISLLMITTFFNSAAARDFGGAILRWYSSAEITTTVGFPCLVTICAPSAMTVSTSSLIRLFAS